LRLPGGWQRLGVSLIFGSVKPFSGSRVLAVVDAAEGILSDEASARPPDEGAAMLARHMTGDESAFPEIIERFGPSVLGYLCRSGIGRAEAEDLFQEAFARVHLHAGTYDPNRSFRGWLFGITHNLLCSHLRRRRIRQWFGLRRRKGEIEPDEMSAMSSSPNPEGQAAAREQVEIVRRVLWKLPPHQRDAVLLTVVEGLSQEDAAEALGVPVPTLKTWVRRGRIQLAAALAGFEVLS
jgi:RNA polymerase sigma-70 factor (ECF subfamily)